MDVPALLKLILIHRDIISCQAERYFRRLKPAFVMDPPQPSFPRLLDTPEHKLVARSTETLHAHLPSLNDEWRCIPKQFSFHGIVDCHAYCHLTVPDGKPVPTFPGLGFTASKSSRLQTLFLEVRPHDYRSYRAILRHMTKPFCHAEILRFNVTVPIMVLHRTELTIRQDRTNR